MGEGLLKHLIRRIRPPYKFLNYKFLVKLPRTSSFPSGHTTSAFAVLGVLWGLNYKWAYMFLLLALLIAFSRLYLCLHYPSDVFAGVILGLLCGKIVINLYKNIYISNLVSSILAMYLHHLT